METGLAAAPRLLIPWRRVSRRRRGCDAESPSRPARRYCGAQCQKDAWLSHKTSCRRRPKPTFEEQAAKAHGPTLGGFPAADKTESVCARCMHFDKSKTAPELTFYFNIDGTELLEDNYGGDDGDGRARYTVTERAVTNRRGAFENARRGRVLQHPCRKELARVTRRSGTAQVKERGVARTRWRCVCKGCNRNWWCVRSVDPDGVSARRRNRPGFERRRFFSGTRPIVTSRPRRRRDSSPRKSRVAAAAPPRRVSTEYPRRSSTRVWTGTRAWTRSRSSTSTAGRSTRATRGRRAGRARRRTRRRSEFG